MDLSHFRHLAQEYGFADVGLCDAASFDAQKAIVSSQPVLKERQQLHFDPHMDYPQARSIAVLLWPYAERKEASGREVFVDSYYAASNAAYHAAKKLEEKMVTGGHFAKANVAYPAKEAAVRCGLGVIGKNNLFIHPTLGSRVVIILVLTDIAAPIHLERERQTCIQCGKCIASCPAGALGKQGMIHPEQCLRNYMMEGVLVPERIRSLMRNTLIGCDICQRVCPMQPNAKSKDTVWLLDDFITDHPESYKRSIQRLSEEIGRNTARTQRVRAQAALICGNIGDERDIHVLESWSESEFDAVRQHSLWAIRQIQARKKALDTEHTGLDQTL